MITKKLIINAVLAGLYVGVTALAVSDGNIDKPLLLAAGAAAIRAAIGYISDRFGKTVPVDA